MLFVLLACVTEAAFPERFAEALCAYHDACTNDGTPWYGCEEQIAAEEAPEYMTCDEWPRDLAAACIREIEDDTDGDCVGGAAWPSCEAMRCE